MRTSRKYNNSLLEMTSIYKCSCLIHHGNVRSSCSMSDCFVRFRINYVSKHVDNNLTPKSLIAAKIEMLEAVLSPVYV